MKPLTAEWVAKAEADYRAADQLRRHEATLTNIISFHCQQCVEKYLKARLQESEIAFPKTHSLPALLNLVTPVEPLWESFRESARILSRFAIETRYPGDDVTAEEADKAFAACRSLREEIRRSLGLESPPPTRRSFGVRERRAKYKVKSKRKRA
jgi:HEPN domain-containing protein